MTDQNNGINRRRFLHGIVVAVGGIIGTLLGLPIVSYFLSPALKDNEVYAEVDRLARPKWLASTRSSSSRGSDWTAVANTNEAIAGEPVEKAYAWRRKEGWMTTSGRSSIWLVKLEDSSFVAYDPHCTHLGCPYSWNEDEALFLCPCHDAAFDINGQVVKGPPPRGLDRYEVKIEGDKIFIGQLIEGSEGKQEAEA
ncbi:MAG: ubiquinol-cytochrome c reductase iron-sulfur subunit [Anaerolineae bacterium]